MQSNPAAHYPSAQNPLPLPPPNPFAPPPNPFGPAPTTIPNPFPPAIPNPFPPTASSSSFAPQTSSRARQIKPAKRIDPATPPPRYYDSPASHFSNRGNNTSRPPTAKVPLSSLGPSVPPLSLIADARYQAMYTTYPSRMRLGTSSLMQPNYLAVSTNGGDPAATASVSAPRRPRHVVNYAEIEGLEDSEDETNDNEGMGTRKRPAPPGMVPKRNGGESDASKPQWGDGKSYLGVPPPEHLVIVQRANATKHSNFSEDELELQAGKKSLLVPIHLDLDVDTFKIRDSFVWDASEKLITADSFARVFCDDLDIPVIPNASLIAKQISEQCTERAGVAEIMIRDEQEEKDNVEKDLRVILNLDVQIGTVHLVDRIEWDLSSPLTPELFTAILVKDLSLPPTANPIILHAIVQELHRHKKNCLEIGLLGENVQEFYGYGNRRVRGARKLDGIWREWNDIVSFGPRIEILTLDDIDKAEADKERAARRAKRDKLSASRTGGRRR